MKDIVLYGVIQKNFVSSFLKLYFIFYKFLKSINELIQLPNKTNSLFSSSLSTAKGKNGSPSLIEGEEKGTHRRRAVVAGDARVWTSMGRLVARPTTQGGAATVRAVAAGSVQRQLGEEGEVPVGEAGEPQWTLGQLLVPEGEAEGILTGLSTTAGCGGGRRHGAEPRGRPARREKEERGCRGPLIAKEAGAGAPGRHKREWHRAAMGLHGAPAARAELSGLTVVPVQIEFEI
jgi:hypothetical protein